MFSKDINHNHQVKNITFIPFGLLSGYYLETSIDVQTNLSLCMYLQLITHLLLAFLQLWVNGGKQKTSTIVLHGEVPQCLHINL